MNYDFAFVDECDAVAEVFDFEHVVAAEEHGGSVFFYVVFDNLPNMVGVEDV